MAEQKLFASHNDYSSLQTQAGGTDIEHRFGWCAAASALWCKSMLDASVAPKDSDPSKLRAGILQVKFRWDSPFGGENVSNLFGHLELRADPACAGVSLAELFDSVFDLWERNKLEQQLFSRPGGGATAVQLTICLHLGRQPLDPTQSPLAWPP